MVREPFVDNLQRWRRRKFNWLEELKLEHHN